MNKIFKKKINLRIQKDFGLNICYLATDESA